MIRKKALRKRIWFSVVDVIERGVVNVRASIEALYPKKRAGGVGKICTWSWVESRINSLSRIFVNLCHLGGLVKSDYYLNNRTNTPFWASWCKSKISISHVVTGA